MPAVSDLYKVVHRQSLFDQVCLNVYFYKTGGAIAGAWDDLAQAFFTNIWTPQAAICSDQLHSDNVFVENQNDLTDFGEFPIGSVASVTGDCLPPFASWAFRLNRVSRSVRNGAKRLPGVPESSQENGVAVIGVRTALLDMATALGDSFVSAGLGATYVPQIAERLPGPPITYSGFDVRNGEYIRISTQNTRKFGRGS